MTSASRLQAAATNFATELDHLLNGTVSVGCSVQPFQLSSGQIVLKPALPGQSIKRAIGMVPLSIADSEQERNASPLWLRFQYTIRLDSSGQHLAVQASSFGYCVNPATDYCLLRVEYVRSATTTQQAHVNVHGESAGLAYAASLTGRPYVPLSKFHIPMGGRRFRPSLEDFIEFLAQERLVTDLHDGWQETLDAHRTGWNERQVRATVRSNPVAAAEQLRADGYVVEGPGLTVMHPTTRRWLNRRGRKGAKP